MLPFTFSNAFARPYLNQIAMTSEATDEDGKDVTILHLSSGDEIILRDEDRLEFLAIQEAMENGFRYQIAQAVEQATIAAAQNAPQAGQPPAPAT